VAEQPKSSDRFSNYVNTYYENLTGGSAPKVSSGEPVSFPSLPKPAQKLGFLGRTMDILSRPMRLISNPVMKAVELPERFDKVNELRLSGQDAAATKESLAAVGSLLAAPFTGFFSDNPDNKAYWSDIIERQSDVANRNDPNYVDVANNVDPLAKGALGFVGDFVLDPLWLIPPLWGAKAAKTAGALSTLGKGTVKAAEDAGDISRVVKETRAAVSTGAIPEAALLPGTSGIAGLGITEGLLRTAPRETFDLTFTVGGKARKGETFSTRAAAEEAVQKFRAGSTRPLVDAGKGAQVFRGSNSYLITSKVASVADRFPAAQASKKIADDLVENAAKGAATSSETVVRSLREIIDGKQIGLGGKQVNLKGELGSFFSSLAKAVPAVKPGKAGKAEVFEKWLPALGKDSRLANASVGISENSILFSPFGRSASLKNVLNTHKNTRDLAVKDAINTEILRPAYEKYLAGVKGGKGVDLVGNAATPTARLQEVAEAGVAATIVRNLKNLDDAERARGSALLGERLFADLQKLDPAGVAKFMDAVDVVLFDTGAVDAMRTVNGGTMQGRFLNLFDINQATRTAAVAKVASNVSDIPRVTPESTLKAAEKISENVRIEDNIVRSLSEMGYPTDKINLRAGDGREKTLFGIVLETLQDVLPGVTKNKLSPDIDQYKHISRTGVRNTEPNYGKGVGVIAGQPNTYFQFDLFLNISKHINSRFFKEGAEGPLALRGLDGKTFKGSKLAAEKDRIILATVRAAEDFYLDRGMALTFDLNGVHTPMRFSQAYRAVKDSLVDLDLGERWAQLVFFNGNSGMAPTQFMEAVSKVIAGGSKEEVLQLLKATKDSRTGKDITKVNFLARTEEVARMSPTSFKSSVAANNLADALMASKAALTARAADNAAEYTARGIEEAKILTSDVSETILSLMNNPTEFASAIRAVAYSGAMTQDFAKAINATQLGATLAAGAVKSGLGEGITTGAKLLDDVASAASSGDPKKIAAAQAALVDDATKTSQRFLEESQQVARDLRSQGDNIFDEVLDEAEINIARPPDKFAQEGYGTVTAATMKILNPLEKFFNSKYGMHTQELLWGSRLFFAQGNLMALVNKPYLKSLKDLMRKNDYRAPVVVGSKTTVIQQALNNVQKGIKSTEGSVLRKAEDDLRPMLTRFFDQTDEMQNVLLGNAFFRTGAGRESINSVLDYNQVLGASSGAAKTPPSGLFFDYDLAIKSANATSKAAGRGVATQDEITQAMLKQWESWDIDDPINFMYTLNRAMVQLSSEVGFITGFKQKALQTGVGSNKPTQGFVKLTIADDSRYGRLLGDEPFYMDPDAAEMFQAIDNFAKSNKQFEGGFGKFVRTTLDPITDTWKYAITLPRPGHHIRNMVGDMTLTYLAEGTIGSVAATNKTWQMMAFKGQYADIDVMKAMTRAEITEVPKGATVMSTGQFGSLSADEIYNELFVRRGILIPARQNEGLLKGRGFTSEEGLMDDATSNKLSRGLEKGLGVSTFGLAARGGRVENFWMNVSEGRDSFVRIQHAMQMLEKAQSGRILTRGYGTTVDPKKLSKDELFDIISERVAKYHPDMSTLSIGESKYLRRLMPFYHWNRGAIQAVSETLLMNPGRITAFPKAGFNIAVAAGLNPDSMYDPFPDDQMFPSFLQQQIEGPQFEIDDRYYGFRPGIAPIDVMNQFASGNPIDTILNNANPAFKIPIELLTGTRLGSQSRIRDYSDFIDSSIPGINYAASISGQSVTGSFYSLLTGGGFDPQYQFERGNKDSRDQAISAFNWLTGLGLTDYSRPSFIRFAQIEQRDENRESGGF